MFRVLNNNNVENALYIQGARPSESLSSIASVVFQNSMSNIGSISAIAASNGNADIVIQTKDNVSNSLFDRLRITHDGKVAIGNASLCNKLNVDGTIFASGAMNASNINAQVLEASNILAQKYSTQKIMFTRNTSSNFARNITVSFRSNEVLLDASCVVSGVFNPARIASLNAAVITTGTLSQSVFPSSFVLNNVSVSNLTALTNASTPRITFTRGDSNVALISTGSNVNITASNIDAYGTVHANKIRVGYPGFLSDEITFYHGMSNWNVTFSNNSNNISTGHARFSRINNLVTLSFRCTLVIGSSNHTIEMSLPRVPQYTTSHALVFTSVDSGNDIFGCAHLIQTSNNMVLKCASLDDGNWFTSGVITYESVP